MSLGILLEPAVALGVASLGALLLRGRSGAGLVLALAVAAGWQLHRPGTALIPVSPGDWRAVLSLLALPLGLPLERAGRGRLGVLIAWSLAAATLPFLPRWSRMPPAQAALGILAVSAATVAVLHLAPRAPSPGRGGILVASALVIAGALLLPGSSIRLGIEGLIIALALLPLMAAGNQLGLVRVAAGLLALQVWTGVLVASLGLTALGLALLLPIALLRPRIPARRLIALRLGLITLLGAGLLLPELIVLLESGLL